MTSITKIAFALLIALAPGSAEPSYDLVVTGGRIMDGTGAAWFYGDIGIQGNRIAAITPAGQLRAARTLDARGMAVAPGFIDIQGQSKIALLNGDGRLIGKITQGITTEILGEGVTNAPANDRTVLLFADPADRKEALRFAGPHGFGHWLDAMEQHGAAVNFGSFVGATTIRMLAKGMDQGAPTAAETAAMSNAVREAMEDGAFGLASALIYPPGEYTTTAELIELAKTMSPYGGVYITHMRSEGDRLLEAIDEAIEIGRKGGVPVEIYHLKAAGVRNWPKMRDAIAKIDTARASGADISADMYPYVAGGTGLTACLPPWASAGGKLFDNLADPGMRRKIRAEIEHQSADWEDLCELATPRGVLITQTTKPGNERFSGKRLSEIAAAQKKDWIEAAMDLILSEHRRVETIFFVASEDNLKLQLRQPWIKFGTDAAGLDPAAAKQLAHPRAYGNFPRVLGHYVRDEKVLPLEDAIRKMTSAAANRLSIQDRGILRAGAFADIVVFDPDKAGDRATYENPHQLSTGIRDVFVNGVAVVRNGEVTGALPGRALYGPGKQVVAPEPPVSVRITPLRPVEDLRREAALARPPEEKGDFREPDLVELAKLDPAIHLDIRYAGTNNFLGTPFYTEPRAFLQRPAAQALLRAHRWLQRQGYGLSIHDGYRPWSVTKMFWEATPPAGRRFVADPSEGSKHNRGCAVDLTLYDLRTAAPAEMPGAYDEMSERSYPGYTGGTALQRWHRDLLRRAMEQEGFTVFEFEWWHFDYQDWPKYPILNIPFEQLR